MALPCEMQPHIRSSLICTGQVEPTAASGVTCVQTHEQEDIKVAKQIVHMTNNPINRYVPDTITINVNDEIVWINDGGSHNAAGTNGVSNFDTGDVPPDGQTESQPQLFPVASTDPQGFRYSCTAHHPTMVGHVIVAPPGVDKRLGKAKS